MRETPLTFACAPTRTELLVTKLESWVDKRTGVLCRDLDFCRLLAESAVRWHW